ncbi:DcuS/MalK family sensor histidine kinase [Alkalihalophilus marmarensis]|uniref:DcuS/MalK family sensor histidine kinase n=1 Tax=Alkalihalophilus marmarensis TaxID=521377 RepID=UPI002E1DDBB1|nr:DcuS/MalK family sensor histidine kinase [Alkalihalophilus marmarensis]MED1600422.1 DcuS/MalK family sensor histidine kinase [Alkalihalophilus marmarensis]
MLMRKVKLRTVVLLLVCMVVLLSLFITDLLVSRSINENSMRYEEEKALTTARIVADSDIVISGLENQETDAVQVYANRVRSSAEVLFVVVLDMNGIRYSHPNEEMVGQPFEGGDEKEVFLNQEYSSISEGTLTTSLRSFTPVLDDEGEQIGAVVVGISLEYIDQMINQNHRNILLGSLFGLLAGVLGAFFMARYIKKTLYGLEPKQIASILGERNAMLESVHEGIIAVDEEGKITLVNKSARKLLKRAGLKEDPIGVDIASFLPMTGLERVLKTGRAELGDELVINDMSFIVNRAPLIVDDKVIGAISTLRDKTEVKELAQQLTGVKLYVEALRSQSHEVKNNLHVILGMLRIGAYDQLKEFILKLVDHKSHEISQVQHVRDPVLSGFLLGKLSYAKECGVTLTIKSQTPIHKSTDQEMVHEMITILGNVINNAIEAVVESPFKKVEMTLAVKRGKLHIEVKDTGPGIKTEQLKEIFTKGYSTKGEGRGYGLANVKDSIDHLSGHLTIDTVVGAGTTIMIDIPYDAEENDRD